MNSALKAACLLFLIPSLTGLAQQQNPHALFFQAEDSSVEHFEALPEIAIRAIANDRRYFREGPATGLKCVPRDEASEPESTLQILCRVLPLSSLPGTNYLAIGGIGLHGAHIVPFWIIHVENGQATLLFSTVSDALKIKKQCHHGYRDLDVTWVMQAGGLIETDTYRYRNGRYRRSSSHQQRN